MVDWRIFLIAFPCQVILGGRLSRRIAQPFRLIGCHDELHSRKEMRNFALVLVCLILPDRFIHGHAAAFELQYGQGNPVDIQDDIRAARRLSVSPANAYLFRYGEFVIFRVIPVDKGQRGVRLAHLAVDFHPVIQQRINSLVCLVERTGRIRSGTLQCLNDFGSIDSTFPSAPFQPGTQQTFFDGRRAGIFRRCFPVSQIRELQMITEQGHNLVLCHTFGCPEFVVCVVLHDGVKKKYLDQADASRQQFLHHTAFHVVKFLKFRFEGFYFIIHVRKDLRNGLLFGKTRTINP